MERFDVKRLERAVIALLAEHRRLREENGSLSQRLVESESRAQNLDQQILELNQRRSDAIKRLDNVISQVDDFESRLTRANG